MKYVYLLLLFLIVSCKAENDSNRKIERMIMTLEDMKETSIRFNKLNYVKIENDKRCFFSHINKLLFINSHFYIMDKVGRKKIFCFDSSGKFVNKFGMLGKGPGEYLRISDFDVDSKGSVHVYSSQSKKIVIYSSEGTFSREIKVPFYANGFKIIPNDRHLFALRNIQGKKTPMYRILDASSHVTNEFYEFSSKDQTNRVLDEYIVANSSSLVAFIPTRDHFHVFNKKGSESRIMKIDFGDYSPSKKFENDASESYKDNKFAYLTSVPNFYFGKLLGDIVIGSKGKSAKSYVFASDTLTKKVYLERVDSKTFTHFGMFPFLGTYDDKIISFVDKTLYDVDVSQNSYPEDIRRHIMEGGFVLTLKSDLCIAK